MIKYYDNNIIIRCYTWDIIDSNSYLITEKDEALLIDIIDYDELLNDLDSFKKVYIILTHSHFDHISGLNKIRERHNNIIVYSTLSCSQNIGNKYRNMSASANVYLSYYLKNKGTIYFSDIENTDLIKSFVCSPSDITFNEKFIFNWNKHSIQLLSVYGHSNDGLLIIFDNKYLFSGDTLLHTPTVTRFIGGSTKLFREHDIPILINLNSSIEKVFPGHGEAGEMKSFISVNI